MGKTVDKLTRLCAWGTSQAVRIPKDLCERLGVGVGAYVTLHFSHDERGSFILLRPEEAEHRSIRDIPYVSMDDIFNGYNNAYRPRECDWGKDVGREVIE